MPPKISIIIPAYNEAGCIGKLVGQTRELFPDQEVIVVNDGSTDDTALEAEKAGAMVYSHPYNMGNGAAVKTGMRKATGDIMVFMDGDNQHDPRDIKKLIELIPKYDMVVGMRRKSDQASIFRFSGNIFFNWLASYVAKFPVKDLTSGFRAIKAKTAKNFIHMLPNSYSYPTTITLGVLRNGLSVQYVPISIRKRITGKSQLKLAKDGVRFFMIIVKICTLYSPMRVFLPVSFVLFVLGISRYAYTYFTQKVFTNMSAFLFIAGLMIFMMGLISEQICQMRYEKTESDPEGE
ncbi:MAG: glycosyltransferase family 2 protein [Proteobacteria bacterium]|nr:glycosyltransferase family 2 protein [Pseudomonadota bacterium]MBU4470254.1 glycosyltransferase family 2 protein [Pseudomonadota bacterium]MCG2752668.1 glycosyltransferase family 2 protein [Desulfobacteraceae bacterium]